MEPQRSFFRPKAMQAFLQKQEKDMLPRFFSPYTATLAYLLLFLLALIGLFAWWAIFK
jgi:hypothetical protein